MTFLRHYGDTTKHHRWLRNIGSGAVGEPAKTRAASRQLRTVEVLPLRRQSRQRRKANSYLHFHADIISFSHYPMLRRRGREPPLALLVARRGIGDADARRGGELRTRHRKSPEEQIAPRVSQRMSFCASHTSPCEPRNAAPASPRIGIAYASPRDQRRKWRFTAVVP